MSIPQTQAPSFHNRFWPQPCDISAIYHHLFKTPVGLQHEAVQHLIRPNILNINMLIALIAVVLVSSIVYVCRPREIQHLSRLQSVEDALERDRSCIDFTYAGPNTSLQQRLELRAAPNLRLRRAFGITNSFTTTDIRKHQKFLRKATRAIGGTNWQRILKSAVGVIRSRTLDEALEQHTACLSRTLLAPFCRGICLRMILDVLFEIRPLSPEEVDIQTIATGINSQWIVSKTNLRTSQSKELNDTLSRVLQLSSDPDMSPQEALGLIMPSYETLWRVVLLTFVTAFHRTVKPMNPSVPEVNMNLAASRNLPPRFRRIAKVRFPRSRPRNHVSLRH